MKNSFKLSLIKSSLLSIFIAIFLSSCYNYKPGYINSPKFEGKGDIYLDVNVGSQFGANLSYSPLNNWGVLVNAGSAGESTKKAGDEVYVNQNEEFVESFKYNNHFYEFATGVYTKIKEDFFIDLYIGYGRGVSGATRFTFDSFIEDQDLVSFQNDFENIFLQTSFKVIASKHFYVSLNGRMNLLRFHNFKYIYEDPSRDSIFHSNQALPPQEKINNFFRYNNWIAYQLGVSMKLDIKHVIFTAQFQLGFEEYNPSKAPHYFNVKPFSVYLGVSIPVGRLIKGN
jgi:hypothetical protein